MHNGPLCPPTTHLFSCSSQPVVSTRAKDRLFQHQPSMGEVNSVDYLTTEMYWQEITKEKRATYRTNYPLY